MVYGQNMTNTEVRTESAVALAFREVYEIGEYFTNERNEHCASVTATYPDGSSVTRTVPTNLIFLVPSTDQETTWRHVYSDMTDSHTRCAMTAFLEFYGMTLENSYTEPEFAMWLAWNSNQ